MPLTSDICEYDPQWPAMFEAERTQIQKKIGDFILAIHHVGSTAKPGMKAKPAIDLLIIAKNIADIDMIHSAMAELGYDVRGEEGIKGRFYYSKNTRSIRTHKAHVCEKSHVNVCQQIVFRDYMRDHPEDARRYGELKIRLAEINTKGMAEYLDGKKDFIERIIETALDKGYGKEIS